MILFLFFIKITGEEILKKVDSVYSVPYCTGRIVEHVKLNKKEKTFTMDFYMKDKKELIVYRSPEKVKGTKILKDGDRIWIYFPRTGRVRRIKMKDMGGVIGEEIPFLEDMEDYMETMRSD